MWGGVLITQFKILRHHTTSSVHTLIEFYVFLNIHNMHGTGRVNGTCTTRMLIANNAARSRPISTQNAIRYANVSANPSARTIWTLRHPVCVDLSSSVCAQPITHIPIISCTSCSDSLTSQAAPTS